ncbi:MAG: hypothetical protein IKM70_03760, partial [Firmicutes bacterium]|nr:hypothetical protein [Bacillota bacterium]
MINSAGDLIFFLLTPFSHIGASLFFARPRFGKAATAGIWLLYVALMMILPPDTPTANFFLTLTAHFILFFVTTTGSVAEKGFLFFSYANIYTCCSTVFSIANSRLHSNLLSVIVAVSLMLLMQVLLYAVLLPAFRRVSPYIHSGWGKFYAVVLGFFVLILAQAAFPVEQVYLVRLQGEAYPIRAEHGPIRIHDGTDARLFRGGVGEQHGHVPSHHLHPVKG